MKHILGPKTRTTLTNIKPGDPQPNAVDLRVDKIFLIRPSVFIISEEEKRHRGSVDLMPDDNGWWTLQEGSYEVVMENIIEVGENEAGWVITRSTLNRNGVFLTSGLYDSGYNGAMAACMHVTSGPMRIQRGTRIGQYLAFDAETLFKYDGSYGFSKDGAAKPEEQKYHAPHISQGTKWMHRGETNERVPKNDIEQFQKLGWSMGRWQDVKETVKG